MIIGIEGLPGSGKSTLMARMALEDQSKGRPYCCNKPMRGADYTPSFTDILRWAARYRNGTIYIEEAGVFMRGRTRSVPTEILDLSAQARHLGIDWVLNFQHRSQIEPELLRLMAVIYQCEKIFVGWPPGGFRGGGYLLAPLFRAVAYRPGEREPSWGHTPILDWMIWRPQYADMFPKHVLIGQSQDSDRGLASAFAEVRTARTDEEWVNLR